MSDLYRELLVKRESRHKDKLYKAGLLLLTALSAAAVLVTPWASLALLALCIFDYFKFPAFDLEFEYLYVNGELDVDKIMSKSKRKRVGSYDMKNLEFMARWDSHEMDAYRRNKQYKVCDYSSGRKEANVYGMVYHGAKETRILLLEPDEIMLKDMWQTAPSKVHTEA